MNTISNEVLQEIIEKANKATHGPIAHKSGYLKESIFSVNGDLGFSLQFLHPEDGREWATEESAGYICAAWNHCAAIAAELLEAREENERLLDKLSNRILTENKIDGELPESEE